MTYYIGCCGYYYKEWKDIFYPKRMAPKDWFQFYCAHFNTVEINATFYRTPPVASWQRWYRDSPDDFIFSVKAPRLITHLKRFQIDKREIRSFYDLVSAGLKEKAGCILFQMPPSFSFTPERLKLICEKLNPHYDNVIEFRHSSWWQPEILETLRQHRICFCGQSYPGELPDTAIVNTKISYYRFHGKPVLYKSLYEKEAPHRVLDETGKKHEKAFMYFNNTWGGAALVNSRQMQELAVSGA